MPPMGSRMVLLRPVRTGSCDGVSASAAPAISISRVRLRPSVRLSCAPSVRWLFSSRGGKAKARQGKELARRIRAEQRCSCERFLSPRLEPFITAVGATDETDVRGERERG
uniref:Uncharacterized protein n=1 Tax=Zea mays TaxID=4577 RepID=A0A804NU50_MAIZE